VSPRTLFRTVAFAEAATWTLLLAGLVLKYGTQTTELGVSIGGGLHGFVFLCYVASTCFTWVNQKWSLGQGTLALAAAFVPYATIPVERAMDRRGKLDGGWRLAAGGERPQGLLEKLQAWVLTKPVTAVVVALAAVAVVFSVLLVAGPPGTWFS
jgi:integral membrane protein